MLTTARARPLADGSVTSSDGTNGTIVRAPHASRPLGASGVAGAARSERPTLADALPPPPPPPPLLPPRTGVNVALADRGGGVNSAPETSTAVAGVVVVALRPTGVGESIVLTTSIADGTSTRSDAPRVCPASEDGGAAPTPPAATSSGRAADAVPASPVMTPLAPAPPGRVGPGPAWRHGSAARGSRNSGGALARAG